MIYDGLFTTGDFTIEHKRYGEPIYLVPFGDVHRDSSGCHVERWKRFLDWAAKKERCYFIGMGDYLDCLSASERKIYNSGYHQSTLEKYDEAIKKECDAFVKEIAFMKGRLVGLIEGNHFMTLRDGISTTQYMCSKLNCQYLGEMSLIRLHFRYGKKDGTRLCTDIFAHHGKSSGKLAGATFNRLDQMTTVAEANIYLQGHDHQLGVRPLERLYLKPGQGATLGHKKIILVPTGSFLRAYKPNTESYAVKALYRPAELGVAKIEITPRRDQRGGKDVCSIDLHASV